MTGTTSKQLIWRYQQQFLIHSYIYYKLDDNIIPDHQYDWICETLKGLMEKHPDYAKELKYHELCLGLDSSGSGFYIQDYPEEIVSRAFHLLYQHKKQQGVTELPFGEFINQWGFVALRD